MRWSDFARFSARELCPLRQCNSAPTHHHWDRFPRIYFITETISTEIHRHWDRFPQRYIIAPTDFHRLTAWVRVEFNTKFDRLRNCAMQSTAIAKKEVFTSLHMYTYAVSTPLTIITITIYFIHPCGKLKLSFDRTTKNISQ